MYNGRKRYNVKYSGTYGVYYTDYLYIKLKENSRIRDLINRIEIPAKNKSNNRYSPNVSFMNKYEFG